MRSSFSESKVLFPIQSEPLKMLYKANIDAILSSLKERKKIIEIFQTSAKELDVFFFLLISLK